MKLTSALLLFPCVVPFVASAASVSFKEDTIVLPTYAPGGYDKTPLPTLPVC